MPYLVDGRYFFTGDSVIFQNGELLPFYRFMNMDNTRAVKSAELIKKISVNKTVCTYHSGIKSGDKEMENHHARKT